MNGNKEVSLNENKISSNYIMTKALKYNIRFLEAMANRSKQSVKDKVQQLADLYKERRISNITTASNMIDKLRAITPKTEKRVLKQFDKLIAKYENKEPLNVRMQQAKEARILSKNKQHIRSMCLFIVMKRGFQNKSHIREFITSVISSLR